MEDQPAGGHIIALGGVDAPITLPDGIGLDEGGIAHYTGTGLIQVLSTTDGHTVHRVTRTGDTSSVEPLDAERW
jgi:hypothetical protein